MSKNDLYFNKLKKIKGTVAFDRVQKADVTEKQQQEELENIKNLADNYKILASDKDSEIKKLRVLLTEVKDLNRSLQYEKIDLENTLRDKYRYDIKERKATMDSYSKLKEKLNTALEGLQFYSDGKHVQKGILTDKIVDRGEHAKDILDQVEKIVESQPAIVGGKL
jgi:hypothetical protein